MSVLLEAALGYAARGWPVLAVRARGKDPLVARGVNGATTDAATITRWWRRWPSANIGIACGRPGPLVLDVDDLDAARAILAKLAEIPAAATARGRHLYFAGLDEPTISVGYGELRGRGSYVVAPPSVHASGKRYVWMIEPNGTLPAVPGFLASAALGAGRGEHEAPAELVRRGHRHAYLKDFVVRLVRAGVVDRERLLAHLHLEFTLACEPLPAPAKGSLEKLADWALGTRIAGRERYLRDLAGRIRERREERRP